MPLGTICTQLEITLNLSKQQIVFQRSLVDYTCWKAKGWSTSVVSDAIKIFDSVGKEGYECGENPSMVL